MAELVGYRLLDQNGAVVASWGGVFGQCPGAPNSISLPSDPPADVQCPVVGETYEQWTLQPWMMEPPAASTDPNDYPLRPDQFFSMMDIAGLTAPVNAAIAAIADPRQQILAKNKLAHTLVFTRDNPLFETLKSAVGVTDAQIDTMWLQAKDL